MKRILMRVGAGVAVLLVVAGGGLAAVAGSRWDRTFEAPYPAIEASSDPAVIERGAYLAYGPMHCAGCHVPEEQWPALEAGERPPLIGGYTLAIPPGTFHAPNLTPDEETGIGRRTDGELARVIRHGVRADGRAVIPFMEYQEISEADLTALVSFLRSQQPVRNPVPDHELRFIGRLVMATVMKPVGPAAEPPAESPAMAPTVERGRYLAEVAAQCFGCHTERNQMDGSHVGPRFAGGMTFDSHEDPGTRFVSPNLTPDPETGIMTGWSEAQFVQRFRAGPILPGTPMPWSAYGQMTDEDIRALYRYLVTLEPVSNDVGAVVRPAG